MPVPDHAADLAEHLRAGGVREVYAGPVTSGEGGPDIREHLISVDDYGERVETFKSGPLTVTISVSQVSGVMRRNPNGLGWTHEPAMEALIEGPGGAVYARDIMLERRTDNTRLDDDGLGKATYTRGRVLLPNCYPLAIANALLEAGWEVRAENPPTPPTREVLHTIVTEADGDLDLDKGALF